MTSMGTVSELWRYPVKSMLGERCEALRMEERGVEGDRLFAVRDTKGKFGSGKSTRRFRPNLVIDVPGTGLVEQAWLGKRLYVGKEVELEVYATTERCGMVAFAQSELPEEPGILRHISQQSGLKFGVYARVVVPGIVHFHDSVALKG
ncbi:putative Fe-S protein [Alcanivorax balearicus MACL04]|uniref:Fe-S protein n=1 Tax=Alloalcanivorax balearicus MACL04 TaxID=1177182 RepID=A0ABT2QTM7_9GAMM|nr:MOSC N-terminal beta barrel domain-containing protein [Alloalcanivorax balearicus]MCU5780876.1 putative Fe-S protein [Alloalcanivorax balearicus MACL04]